VGCGGSGSSDTGIARFTWTITMNGTVQTCAQVAGTRVELIATSTGNDAGVSHAEAYDCAAGMGDLTLPAGSYALDAQLLHDSNDVIPVTTTLVEIGQDGRLTFTAPQGPKPTLVENLAFVVPTP
jgi:hypothetical protein